MPTPTRHHVNAPVKASASSTWLAGGGGGWGAAAVPGQQRVQSAAPPTPSSHCVRGAALPKFAGRCPSPSPTRGPGGRGA